MRRPAVQAKAVTAPKVRVKGDLVPPTYILKLMEHAGPTAAAKEIGTTPGTLHKGRNAGVVSRVYEVAARGIWAEQGYGAMEEAQADSARTSHLHEAVQAPTSEGVTLMLVQVPKGRESIVEKTVAAIGGVVSVQT